ncbi:NAD(P)H-dependent oxidoreductase [Bradyrhizobium vignae]|uniref:NAD(P)H-dependent oxidoreductase n=1 Tax=Bradyrhizobium vignae TaxID=1549949 RepID=UPI00100BD4B8|nr:NAD(P)H-dependent oxidoreductase [Bradyrhizobium vignae]RXH06662.1 flavodoxin family protein [Bradyrhizobium vignae]
MNVLLVFAHQEPRSFNGALRDIAVRTLTENGCEVAVSDLYAEGFEARATAQDFTRRSNPKFFKYQAEQRDAAAGGDHGFSADILREQERLLRADLVIFQFPLYWFSVPAILKGWFDRVLAAGFAYGGGRFFEKAPLYGKRALLSLSMGAAEDRFGPSALYGDLNWVLHPLRVGTLNFCGFEVLDHHVVHGPASMTPAQREEVLERWQKRVCSLANETPLPFMKAFDPVQPGHSAGTKGAAM